MGHTLATERISSRDFFEQDTIDVAEQLIGCFLCRKLASEEVIRARIVETEAYLGTEDPSCHSFSGRPTPRTAAMFGPKGYSYVYFIYGVYFCFNIVTGAPHSPEAVLIRALEHERDLRGPGKLCRELMINKNHNQLDLTTSEEIWIEYGQLHENESIAVGPRIGLNNNSDPAHWPLRYGLAKNRHLSRPFSAS